MIDSYGLNIKTQQFNSLIFNLKAPKINAAMG